MDAASGSLRSGSGEVMFFFFLSFLIQFNVPFSPIETSQSVGGAKREYPGKTT